VAGVVAWISLAKPERVPIVYNRMRSLIRYLVVGGAVLLLAPVAAMRAQDAPADDGVKKITVIPNPVVLQVVVRDKKGALVGGLTKDDFTLSVREKPQTIKSFDPDGDAPLTVGLVVDVNRALREKLPDLLDDDRKASQVFLEAMLKPAAGTRPADSAFVVQFAKQIELLQDVTGDKPKLQKALQELGTESPSFKTKSDPDTTDSEGRKVRGGGTSLYDAVFLSGDELTSKLKGRKVLVMLTDGVDVGSKETLTDVIETVQEANTIVYAIYIKGQQKFDQQMGNPQNRRSGGYPGGGYPGGGYPGGGYPGGGGGYPGSNPGGGGSTPNGPSGGSRKPSVDGRQVLERLCGETGGRVFELSKKQPIDDIYNQIAEELRAQYRLEFVPDEAAARFGLHPIDLEMRDADKNKKMDIQTRSGYYGGDTK
jgi:VWFA-related protein